jgi:hypothetical protein
VVLYAAVNGEPSVTIIPFTIGAFESSTVDLHFAPDDKIIPRECLSISTAAISLKCRQQNKQRDSDVCIRKVAI